jgi:hypothetical protein
MMSVPVLMDRDKFASNELVLAARSHVRKQLESNKIDSSHDWTYVLIAVVAQSSAKCHTKDTRREADCKSINETFTLQTYRKSS